MKNILTAVVSSFLLAGCAKDMPDYPSQLKDFHLVEVRGEDMSFALVDKIENIESIPNFRDGEAVRCLHFDVIQVNPYKFNFTGIVSLKSCHEVAGYKPDENIALWNWIDDVFRWAEEKKNRP